MHARLPHSIKPVNPHRIFDASDCSQAPSDAAVAKRGLLNTESFRSQERAHTRLNGGLQAK